MGFVSYCGLIRFGSGPRFQPAVRWGWNRCYDTYSWSRYITQDLMDVKTILDEWVESKEVVPVGDLKRILRTLRRDGHFSQALKVYEWMRKKCIYKFSSRDHAVWINLISKVRGCSAAEQYVRHLPEQARKDKTYGELLHCYVDKHRTENALYHFEKMKELGFVSSPRPFNEMMRLYAKSIRIDKVLEVFAELKKSNVSPDNDSYRICISSFGIQNDLDGMERMLREMETQPHIVMDWCTYAVVAEFYDRELLVDKATDALKKVKMMLQEKNSRRNRSLTSSDFESVVKSLVKLGELDKAMKFFKEWDVLGNWQSVHDISIPWTIIKEYIENGALRKAYYRTHVWTRKGKAGADKLSRLVCNEYLKAGDLFRAYECFRGTCLEFGPLAVQKLFLQYLEEECRSFFPLCCSGPFCTTSLKTDAGNTFLELSLINAKYKIRAALLRHPEDLSTRAVNMDYENVMKSLVESGELNEAVEMAMEWEASGRLSGPDVLNVSKLIIDHFCKKSLFTEAVAMAEAWTRDKERCVEGIWLILACHCQEHGELVRGWECMMRYFKLRLRLKDHDRCLMFEIFVRIVGYSRGMIAAASGHCKEKALYLDRLLCPN